MLFRRLAYLNKARPGLKMARSRVLYVSAIYSGADHVDVGGGQGERLEPEAFNLRGVAEAGNRRGPERQ